MGKRGFSKCLNPTAWVRALRCNTVYITRYHSMRVPVSIRTSYFMADKKALVDSGATDNFMHPAFAKRMGLGLQELPTPKKIFNIDNTSNKSGMITHFLDLNVQTDGINKEMRFLVTDIGHEEILLGYPWLATFEPRFQWRSAVIDERVLPIIISSINPRSIKQQPVIATGLSEDIKQSIVRQLETECHVQSVATNLAIEAGAEQNEATLPEEYKEFTRLFSDEAADRFPPAREWDHAIDLKPGAPDALDCKVYPMTRDEDTALEKFLDEMVAKGYIRPSKSPYASPFFFVKKKDGKLRPVQDYRRLNSHTVRNQYPLPLIAQLISDLSGAWIFSKVDVRQGYNNVRIKKGDEWKAAFKTKFGHWEPLVMFFGLTNSPSTFQEMMNVIYKEVIEKHAARGTIIRIYMDDIAIATSGTRQDHIDAVHDVLRVAEQHDLYFKLSKCTFHASSIDYLGVIIEKGMTRMDPVKIAGIKNWPTPTKVKDVRSFLGFCNFYRPFIQGFAHLARPLNELTRKDAEWSWEDRQQKAFDELKKRVTTEPVLAHPILTDPFELEVDASGFAMGAVLLQKKDDGKKHPIAYYSKTLSAAERNYDIYDLELLAIVNAMDHWRPYLAGSPHKVIIYSDHQNLLYWKEPHKISRRVAREVLMLSEYNFEIRHIKGTANGRADALSRRPDYDQGHEDNQNIVVLPEQVFARAMEVLPDNTNQEESTLKPWIDPHQLKQHQGVWYKDGRQVVTGDIEAKRHIIQSHHDSPVYGHPGISKTIQLTERLYWWPRMRVDITEYVKGCADCQRHKVNTRPTKAPLHPIYPKAETTPFETVALDFIVKLPISQGFDSILTITDQGCTKAAIFIPCNEDITAEETAALYIKHVFAHFGLPTKVISDRDPHFMSKFIQAACKVTGVKHAPSTAYHPRTDGQSERSNQWLETAIRFITDQKQKNWAPYLPIAQFAHNNWPSDTTRKSPFFLLMGFNPRADWIHATSPIPKVTLRLEQLKEARIQARDAMIKAQQSWVKHRDTPKYKEGDLVWLEGKNLRVNQPTAKLAPRRHGPFKIIQVMSTVNYRLELPTQWSIHPMFHIDLLTPYKETIMHGPNFTRPTPELIDGEEEYSVEKILDSRHFGRRRRLQYLVKWEGYPDAENMWVDKDDVFADDKVREFKASNPDAATHIRSTSVAKSTHSPTSTRSHLLHRHALTYMSSDGNNDLAHEYTAGAVADSPIPFSQTNPIDTPVTVPVPIVDFATLQSLDPAATVFSPRPVTASSSASDVAAMFRQLRVHTPAPLTPDGQRVADQANDAFVISFTPAERRGRQAGSSLEPGATARSEAALGATSATTDRPRTDPYDSSADDDIRRCTRCGEQREYCHGHTPVVPNSSLDLPPNPPRVTLSGSVPPNGVARFNLSRAEATALAARLATSLGQDNQDPAPVPPVRDYREEFARVVAESLGISTATAAEGLGLRSRRGRRGGQGRGNRSNTVPDNERPRHTQPTPPRQDARRPASPTPPGFEHNRGPAYIPFRIRTDTGGETPARYIQAHLDAPNPFVEGRLSINGPTYHSEIHAAPIVDIDILPPPISADILRLLDTDYMGHDNVDEAIGEIGDRSLRAEVNRYRRLERKRKSFQESIRHLEDQMFTTDVERWMCVSRLEAARAMVRIQAEMQSNRQAFRLSPWSLERGRLP
jgi:hypothetical protein